MMLTKYLKLTFNCILIDISDTFNLIKNNSRGCRTNKFLRVGV